MADTMRNWAVGLSSGLGEAQRVSNRLGLRTSHDFVKVEVEALVEGVEANYTAVLSTTGEKWLLIGDRGPGKSESWLKGGYAVIIKMPIWEIDMEGEVYIVAVNWTAADPG